ncbi:MAG: acyl-CoA dehydrogenase family protein [Gemmatimonadetes bacterium]|nr:acyl-CoA dehydrogenase family protein [Gemmatimonadota bacterium]
MDFSWSDEQLELYRSIASFAQKELNDHTVEHDHAGIFPRDLWRKAAEFGILGLPFPEEYGGSGQDILTTLFALEALGYGCRDNGLIFGLNAQMWAVQTPIVRYGSDAQKQAYLPKLISGAWIGAHGMTEPDAGSDAFALSTAAVKRGDRYVLNGTKIFTSNAPTADLFLIFATMNRKRGFMGITAFLIDKGTPGLSVSKPIEKMGLRTSPMGEVVLENCEVGPDQRLGREGNGGTIFKHSMMWERCSILASYVGTMQRQIEVCTRYAKERRQFDSPIGAFQAVSHRIVDMKVRLESARLLLYRAGWLRARGEEAGMEVAMAKLYLSEAAVQNALDAIQVHGGYGYTTEFGIERELRDAVGGRLYSGTSEIQKELIAGALGL